MFSEKATEGASKVADEQLMMADSTAPKKMAWAKIGVWLRTSVGRTSCESVLQQAVEQFRVDQRCRVGDEHRHEGEAEIDRGAEDRAPQRNALAPGRGDALEDVLLRDRAEHHGDPGAEEGQPQPRVGRREEVELAGCRGVVDDHFDAAGQPGDNVADVQHAAHDDAHLDEIEDGYREHAAEGGVGQDDGGEPRIMPAVWLTIAVGDDIEDQPERLDLSRYPAQVGLATMQSVVRTSTVRL